MNIPTLPFGEIVNEDKTPTDQELTFRQNLVSELQLKAGEEGLVAPTQNAADIIRIKDSKRFPIPGNTTTFDYTCEYGTILYDSTNNRMVVAIDDGFGAPIFKEIVLI